MALFFSGFFLLALMQMHWGGEVWMCQIVIEAFCRRALHHSASSVCSRNRTKKNTHTHTQFHPNMISSTITLFALLSPLTHSSYLWHVETEVWCLSSHWTIKLALSGTQRGKLASGLLSNFDSLFASCHENANKGRSQDSIILLRILPEWVMWLWIELLNRPQSWASDVGSLSVDLDDFGAFLSGIQVVQFFLFTEIGTTAEGVDYFPVTAGLTVAQALFSQQAYITADHRLV